MPSQYHISYNTPYQLTPILKTHHLSPYSKKLCALLLFSVLLAPLLFSLDFRWLGAVCFNNNGDLKCVRVSTALAGMLTTFHASANGSTMTAQAHSNRSIVIVCWFRVAAAARLTKSFNLVSISDMRDSVCCECIASFLSYRRTAPILY